MCALRINSTSERPSAPMWEEKRDVGMVRITKGISTNLVVPLLNVCSGGKHRIFECII